MLDKKASSRSKCQKDKVTGNDFEIKSFFAHIFVKSVSISVKPRIKWSLAHSAHHRIHFIRFVMICNH